MDINNEFNDILNAVLWLNDTGNKDFKNLPISRLRYFEIKEQNDLNSPKEVVEKYLMELFKNFDLGGMTTQYLTRLSKLDNWHLAAEKVLSLLPRDAIKIRYLEELENLVDKAKVIASFKDDELKRKYLKDFSREEERAIIISSFSSDEEKLALLDKFHSNYEKVRIIKSLESDEKKKEYIFSGKVVPTLIPDIIASMKNDDEKEALLPLVSSDTARFRIIVSMNDVQKKKDLFETSIRDERVKKRKKSEFIMSLPKAEQFYHFMELDDKCKALILQDCNLATQLEFVNLIEDKNWRKLVMHDVEFQEVSMYVDANSKNRNGISDKIADVVRYTSIKDAYKFALMQSFIKDKLLFKELLDTFNPNAVIKDFFHYIDKKIPIDMLEEINASYNIFDKPGIMISAQEDFELDDEQNQELINKINGMNAPELSFEKMTYSKYQEFKKKFDSENVKFNCRFMDLEGRDLSLEELEKLEDDVLAIYRQAGKTFIGTKQYIKGKRIFNEIYHDETDERLTSIKSDLEAVLASGKIGDVLLEAKSLFEEAYFSEEEQRMYGSNILKRIYVMTKNGEMSFALDEDSVTILHEWDMEQEILSTDLKMIASNTSEITQNGIKRAISLAFESGVISDAEAATYIINGLIYRHITKEGAEWGAKIALNLLRTQGLSIDDIKVMEPGSYSDVLAIGQYVLKLGDVRETSEVPEHDRILEPVLKFEVFAGVDEENAPILPVTFIEVQPRVILVDDLDNFEASEKREQLYELYSELRRDNIMWGDAAERNIGIIEFSSDSQTDVLVDIREELDKTANVISYRSKKMTPKKGEKQRLVILDTDYIYDVSGMDNLDTCRTPSTITTEFEKRYQREQTQKRMLKIQKRKEAAKAAKKGESYGE